MPDGAPLDPQLAVAGAGPAGLGARGVRVMRLDAALEAAEELEAHDA
ncbi:hypothetical protein ACWEGS_07300 [Streptomyces sp. NPDC004822]|nr:hypothetical protein [Streptomyces sp. SS1-1]